MEEIDLSLLLEGSVVACCCSCKNLDTKKKVDGAVRGAKYYCKKLKTYVPGNMDSCEKFESCFRSNDDCDKIFDEGKVWDNDKNTGLFYFIIGLILLIISIIVFLFNRDMY